MISVKIQSPATLPPPPVRPSSEQIDEDLTCLGESSSGDIVRKYSGDSFPSSLICLATCNKFTDGDDDDDDDESDPPTVLVESEPSVD